MKTQFLLTVFFCLLLFLFYNLCTGQVKVHVYSDSLNNSHTKQDNGLGLPKTQDEMQTYLEGGVDPYFVETTDTFSSFGPQCIVRNMIQDKAGNIWLASWHGIIRYDPSAALRTGGRVFTNYTYKERLIHFHVISLFEDSKGNIWFGTARGGIYRYDPSALLRSGAKSFTLFTTNDGLPDNTINCIAEDENGNIWLGTEKGVSRYDYRTFTNYNSSDGLSDNYINTLMKDNEGRIWIGTNNGINIYSPSTMVSERSRTRLRTSDTSFTIFTVKDSLPFKKVSSLLEDRFGNIWIGSDAREAGGRGLCRIPSTSPNTGTTTSFRLGPSISIKKSPSASSTNLSNSVSDCIIPYFVMYMCEDRKGNLWFAHNKGTANVNFALYKYNQKTITKIIEQTDPDNPVIFGIMEDKKGNVWFGTANGVCRYDGKTFNYFLK